MKRWLVGGGIVVGVAVAMVLAVAAGMLVGAGGISVGGISVGGSPAAVSPSAAPEPTPTVSAGGRAAAKATRPVALFVGDSYTVGQGASSPAERWSTLVAREMGWVEQNVADGGTGFVSRHPAKDLLSYEEQLRSVRFPERIDIVVIAGGQNDFPEVRTTPTQVFGAVAETYALAARRFPDARIVAVGPSTPWVVGLEARALDDAVRVAAEEHGARYVSLLDPDVVRDRDVHPDGIHVGDRGYAAIARQVVSQIS